MDALSLKKGIGLQEEVMCVNKLAINIKRRGHFKKHECFQAHKLFFWTKFHVLTLLKLNGSFSMSSFISHILIANREDIRFILKEMKLPTIKEMMGLF